MNEIFNHLWQSTAFAVAIGLGTLALRRNSPRVRYWLWFAASVKFLIPFSLLVATGSKVQLPPDTPSLHAVTVQQISIAFSPVVHARFHWEWIGGAIWAVGALFLIVRWFGSSSVLRLPEGLTDEQLSAVVAHEQRHIECYDNLAAALHMVAETLFWFHPLVWWIGARMMDERERDCDEAVLRQGSQPSAYARSIVQVCSTYVESPLACASGIGGADLKKRIREIMTWRGSLPVTGTGKAMLAVAAVAAVSLPFVLGVLRAQTLPPASTLSYDVVSIRKSPPDGKAPSISPGPEGGLRTHNTPMLLLIGDAYNVQGYQIIGAPGWASSQGFDITFTPDKAEALVSPSSGPKPAPIAAAMDRDLIRLQAVLRDRFGLVLRSETREMPIYNLVQAKGGAKLPPPASPGGKSSNIRSRGGQLIGTDVTVARFAELLSTVLERPVRDLTELSGSFDFKVVPDADESIIAALSEQLGLKVESAKGPVQVYVVEKLLMPSGN
jgi:uncharacterized protein (TIGR03435 family)